MLKALVITSFVATAAFVPEPPSLENGRQLAIKSAAQKSARMRDCRWVRHHGRLMRVCHMRGR